MLNEYLTLAHSGEDNITEKKSTFIGNAAPVQDEEEALHFINNIRSKYFDAKHHVFAYVIGLNNDICRFSDAGEPAGTGGRPVLEAIKNEQLRNVLVVVTRYFGGVLLGTGGLARAYGKAAALSLQQAGVVRKIVCRKITFSINYTLLGKTQNYLASQKIMIKDIYYTDKVTMVSHVEIDRIAGLTNFLNELCHGDPSIEFGDEIYETASCTEE